MAIKIGVVVATSGPVALLGKSFIKAVHLAQEDLRGTTQAYELRIQEISSPEQAEPAIQGLIAEPVQALIVGLSISGRIARTHAAAAKIPMFCVCSVGDIGDELFTFTMMPLGEDEAIQWMAEARRRGIKRIARITQDYPSIENHVRALKAEAGPVGIEFVYEHRFDGSTIDFTRSIEEAKQASPDVYFVEAFNPALDLLGAQLRGAGIVTMASVVALSLSEHPETFEGSWYTDSYMSPEFKARLDRRYPGEKLATHMMPYAYDSLRLLVEGFESGDVLKHIRNVTEYKGTAGSITKKAGTGNFRSAPAVWVIKNGKPTLALTASGAAVP